MLEWEQADQEEEFYEWAELHIEPIFARKRKLIAKPKYFWSGFVLLLMCAGFWTLFWRAV